MSQSPPLRTDVVRFIVIVIFCSCGLALGQVRREALRQAEELDELTRMVDLQQARLEAAVVGRRRALEAVERGKERLQEQIDRVLPLSRSLTAAHHRVQVI